MRLPSNLKVPVWIVLNLPKDSSEVILDYLATECEAYNQPLPHLSFLKTVGNMAKQGWKSEVKDIFPYTVGSDFILLAAANHTGTALGPNKMLSEGVSPPYSQLISHKLRTVTQPSDFNEIYQTILAAQEDTVLLDLFSLTDKLRPDSKGKQNRVFVSEGPVDPSFISRLANKTIMVDEYYLSKYDEDTDEVVNSIAQETLEALSKLGHK